MARWLALYVDRHGKSRSAIVTPADPIDFPFGVDEFALNLADYDGEPVTLVEMPDDPEFNPMVVDVTDNVEVPTQFIDL